MGVEEVRRLLDRFQEKVVARLFSAQEAAWCERGKPSRAVCYAACLATKEAFTKALSGRLPLSAWPQLELIPSERGWRLTLDEPILRSVPEAQEFDFQVSWSEAQGVVVAIVIGWPR